MNELKFDVRKLPPRMKNLCQPMNISVNQSFKAFFGDCWIEYQVNLKETDRTKKGNIQALMREEKIKWISQAWEKVTA